jgi:hypothetical protein
MATNSQKEKMLNTLGMLAQTTDNVVNKHAPVVQEVTKRVLPKKVGRKNHKTEGVEYVRLSPAIPKDLKIEMEVAMRTTHRECPTIDTFVTEAIRSFLAKKS